MEALEVVICLSCGETEAHSTHEAVLVTRAKHRGCGGVFRIVREPQSRKAMLMVLMHQAKI